MALDNRSGRLGKGRSVTGRSEKGIRQRKFDESYQWMSPKERIALITGLIFGFYLSQVLEELPQDEIDAALERVSNLMRGKKIPQNSADERFGDNYLGAARQMTRELISQGSLKSQNTAHSASVSQTVLSSLSSSELVLLGGILVDMIRDELEQGEGHLGVSPLIAAATKKALEEVQGVSFSDDIFPKGIQKDHLTEASRIFMGVSKFMNLEVFKPSDS